MLQFFAVQFCPTFAQLLIGGRDHPVTSNEPAILLLPPLPEFSEQSTILFSERMTHTHTSHINTIIMNYRLDSRYNNCYPDGEGHRCYPIMIVCRHSVTGSTPKKDEVQYCP